MEEAMRYQAEFDRVIDRSATDAEKYTLRKKLFHTEDVLPMWVADMDIVTPPFVREAVRKKAAEEIYGYEEIDAGVYDAQIGWMARRHGWGIRREQLLYVPSVVTSINLAIQAFSETGDGIIVQTPIYPPFFRSIANNGRTMLANALVQNERGRYEMDFADLESKMQSGAKMLLLCSPHNPTGRVWSKEELARVGALCQKYGVICFSDEIHGDITYAPHKHTPFAALDDACAALSVTAIGVGKSFNLAGGAFATVAIPDERLRKRFERVYKSIHFAQGNSFGKVAFQAAYESGDIWVDELSVYLRENIDIVAQTIADSPIRCYKPEGTYLMWLDCRALGLRDKALRDLFVHKARLGLGSGISFSKEGSGFMRLNIAVPRAILLEARRRLRQLIEAF